MSDAAYPSLGGSWTQMPDTDSLIAAAEAALEVLEWRLAEEVITFTEDPNDAVGELVCPYSVIGKMVAAVHGLRRALGHPDAPLTSDPRTWLWSRLKE